jgi:hypothetical protein
MSIRSAFVRIVFAALVALQPAARQAHAQEGGVPQEETVADLRDTLEILLAWDRQRAMFGLPPAGGVEHATIALLKAEFDEDIMPGLMFAEQDCFFAEVPLGKAVNWARAVQLQGLGDEFGPLWEEAAVVQESLGKVLVNCHKQIYERCVMDDGDPNVEALPGITRQLGLMGFEGDYEAKTQRCETGWNGKVTIRETLNGRLSKTDSMAGASVSTNVVFSGERSFKVELISRGFAIGEANGRSEKTENVVARSDKCTTTMDQTGLRTASGSGDAFLRKISTESGKLVISFSGPAETGRSSVGGRMTFSDSKCGQNGNLPEAGAPLPPMPWPGQISETLDDPLTEVITGSKSLTFSHNSLGVPVPAQDTPTGVARIPAIPGMPRPGAVPGGGLDAALPSQSALLPWLELVQPDPTLEGEPPVVHMQIDWELIFGGGI